MKTRPSVFLTSLTLCWLFLSSGATAQVYYLQLQNIIHNAKRGYAAPSKFEADARGGSVEFDVVYYKSGERCPEEYRLRWIFDENMEMLPGENGKWHEFGFELHTATIDGNCGEVSPWRNPFVEPSADNGGTSRIMSALRSQGVKYRTVNTLAPTSGRVYFRKDEKYRKSDNMKVGYDKGSFKMRTFDQYAGRYAYFLFKISGGSNKDRNTAEGFSYEVVYLYKIVGPDDIADVVMTDTPTSLSGWTVNYGSLEQMGEHVQTSAPGEGKTSYYVAPLHLLGNWANHTKLCFDLKSWGGSYYGPDSYGAEGDVIIKSGNMVARYDLSANHNGNWQSYCIGLNDRNWTLSDGAQSMSDILGNVTDLRIRAEYGAGTDHSSLRNVRLETR